MAEADVPKGNFLARTLRLLNENSTELFPKTPAETKAAKFHSMYKTDYHEFPTDVLLEGLKPKLVGKIWSVQCELIIADLCQIINLAKVADPETGPQKAETPRLVRQSTLPAIPTVRDQRSKSFTPKPRISASDVFVPRESLHRSKTTMDKPSPRNQPSRPRRSELEWQHRMPEVDKRLLKKILRLQEQDSSGMRGSSLKGTLLPDARRTVERWMESASEEERQVALKFFTSLAGSRLMGGSENEQTVRLQQVISALRSTNLQTGPEGEGRTGKDRRFRYLKMLDDETRQQRWMHTTWHHLPNYRLVNPVTNSSSHYIRPHALQHRHFVIHPDWG